MTKPQADWLGGRLSFQAKEVLDAKAVRSFLIKNPGCTRKDMEAAKLQSVNNSLQWLLKRKLATFAKDPEGVVRWNHLEMRPA